MEQRNQVAELVGDASRHHYQPKPRAGEEVCRQCGIPYAIENLSIDLTCDSCLSHEPVDRSQFQRSLVHEVFRFLNSDVYIKMMGTELRPDQWKTLRNRAEDQLRKSPQVLKRVVAMLAAEEFIRYEDVLYEDEFT